MSRHIIYRDDNTEVVVGFDRPLQELFCQWLSTEYVPALNLPLALETIWREAREHGSVSPAIMDSVTRELIKEAAIQDKDLTNRTIDWTKGIPTEGI